MHLDGLYRATLSTLAVIATMLVLGCGGSDDEASEPTGGNGGAAHEGGVADAVEHAEAYRQVPEFKAPGESFDARKAVDGKTILVIPVSSSINYVQNLFERMKGAAEKVGVNIEDWPNRGTPADWVRGMETGINQKVDSIELLGGIDPAKLGPQIKAAKEAGIPVVVSTLYDVDQAKQEAPPDVTATMSLPYEQGGRLMADWTIADSEGEANVLVLTMNEVVGTESLVKGIREEFEAHCPDCKVDFLDVTIANFQRQLQPQVETRLTQDPDINYVFAIYDSAMAPFAQAAIRTAGAQDRVKLVASDGTPSILKDLQNDNLINMDVGYALDWIGHAILDQHMRVLAGLEPLEDPGTPLRIFDETNVDDTGSPPEFTKGYGDSYLAGYEELWQLNK